MSGHSKWSKIKHQKGISDVKKSNVFSKLSRAISMAVASGGGITVPENNFKLRLAIEKAKSFNMPKSNIDRAIDRGAQNESGKLQEVVYEAFAHEGVGMIIVTTTDNPARTVSAIRNVLDRYGAKLAVQGSVMHQFIRCALIIFTKNQSLEDKVLAFVDQIGAIDIESDEDSYFVYFPYVAIGHYNQFLNGLVGRAELDYKPQITIPVAEEKVKQIITLADALREMDDVEEVFTNIA